MRIAIINGPNLNLTGVRKPDVYGCKSFEEYIVELQRMRPDIEIVYRQSNHEGDVIDYVQQFGVSQPVDGIILNPGALAHYSYAVADAVEACEIDVVEVHISNIYSREEHRHVTVTGAYARAVIAGLGLEGYRVALEWLASRY